jgi:hypothetical protein
MKMYFRLTCKLLLLHYEFAIFISRIRYPGGLSVRHRILVVSFSSSDLFFVIL